MRASPPAIRRNPRLFARLARRRAALAGASGARLRRRDRRSAGVPGLRALHGRGAASRAALAIVSHKSRYAAAAPGADMRVAAARWLEAQHFVGAAGIAQSDVFFEATRSEKLDRVCGLGLTHFIDDLADVLADPGFPAATRAVHFRESWERCSMSSSDESIVQRRPHVRSAGQRADDRRRWRKQPRLPCRGRGSSYALKAYRVANTIRAIDCSTNLKPCASSANAFRATSRHRSRPIVSCAWRCIRGSTARESRATAPTTCAWPRPSRTRSIRRATMPARGR